MAGRNQRPPAKTTSTDHASEAGCANGCSPCQRRPGLTGRRSKAHASRQAETDKALLNEGRFRPFEPADIPRIALFYDRTFDRGEGKPSPRLCDHFDELFFKNPWADPRVPSWIYETNQGDIKAFVAKHPRRMVFDGEPIMCAAGGYWMVSEDYRRRGLGSLIARYSAEKGPALMYTDTGRPYGTPGIGIWERTSYGSRILVSSIQWEYMLRSRRAAETAGQGPAVVRLPRRISDEIRLRKRRSRTQSLTDGAQRSELTPDTLGHLPQMLPPNTRFYPQYDAEYVSWLLKVAANIYTRGELSHSTVLSRDGSGIDGWYFFYLAQTGKAEVMQIVSKQGAQERVLAQLFAHAYTEGAAFVMGYWCGHDILLAAQNMGCHIGYIPSRTALYTHNTEIMRAIMCGDYFLSAFEGDSWLDLSNR